MVFTATAGYALTTWFPSQYSSRLVERSCSSWPTVAAEGDPSMCRTQGQTRREARSTPPRRGGRRGRPSNTRHRYLRVRRFGGGCAYTRRRRSFEQRGHGRRCRVIVAIVAAPVGRERRRWWAAGGDPRSHRVGALPPAGCAREERAPAPCPRPVMRKPGVAPFSSTPMRWRDVVSDPATYGNGYAGIGLDARR